MAGIRGSFALVTSLAALALGAPGPATGAEPDHIRGQITAVQRDTIDVRTSTGRSQPVRITEESTIILLTPASFVDVEFGTYVGAVSEKLDDRYSPIYRDSLSWLHKGLELRIVDEKLRGIALGHMKWDLTPISVMTHGWVDDLEIRVISIKYGPTEEEETDVEVGRDIRVLKMALADRRALKPGAHVFVGANKAASGHVALFVMVGADGVIPGL
jgi:hypothetical protein